MSYRTIPNALKWINVVLMNYLRRAGDQAFTDFDITLSHWQRFVQMLGTSAVHWLALDGRNQSHVIRQGGPRGASDGTTGVGWVRHGAKVPHYFESVDHY